MRTNPAAPASRAAHSTSSSSNVVSTSTGGASGRARSARVASMPLTCGIRTSISTTSASSSAASSCGAVAELARPPRSRRRARGSARCRCGPAAGRRRARRGSPAHLHTAARPAPASRPGRARRHGAADDLRPFPHADETVAGPVVARGCGGAGAGHVDDEGRIGDGQPDVGTGLRGVPARVGERLGDDPVGGQADRRFGRVEVAVDGRARPARRGRAARCRRDPGRGRRSRSRRRPAAAPSPSAARPCCAGPPSRPRRAPRRRRRGRGAARAARR